MTFRIDVAGFTIWGERPTRVPAPVFIDEGGFTGWDDTPDLHRESNARANAHGDFDAPGYYTARTASFSGKVVTDTEAETASIGRRMRGLLAGGASGQVTVERSNGVEWATGRLASATKFSVHGADPTVADWQMQFWFPDPRKFGELHTYDDEGAGSVAAAHYGNFDATPKLVVSGTDANGYTIAGPDGKLIEVTLPLVAAYPHTINLATGNIASQGKARWGVLKSADMWTIPPGQAVTHTISGGSGSTLRLKVNVFDTYI